jgi:hypothetical protein
MLQEEVQKYRTTERRHMIAAKDALKHGAGNLLAGNSRDVAFVLACVAVPPDDAEDQQILTDIERTLNQTNVKIEMLGSARDQFESKKIDVEAFRVACDDFLDFYNRVLARRKDPAQTIIQKHIDADTYWQQTDDVTTESIETEKLLFGNIGALAPSTFKFDIPAGE